MSKIVQRISELAVSPFCNLANITMDRVDATARVKYPLDVSTIHNSKQYRLPETSLHFPCKHLQVSESTCNYVEVNENKILFCIQFSAC